MLAVFNPVQAEEVKIGNVLAPRAALNFKGNTAWPYGLCEVRLLTLRNMCHLFYLFMRDWRRVDFDRPAQPRVYVFQYVSLPNTFG